jgi:hypothetical protein
MSVQPRKRLCLVERLPITMQKGEESPVKTMDNQ